jgi:hypothetical protein
LAFSYWIDNLGFITEGKLAAVLIKPSLGVSNWPVIYFINYMPTSSLALFITAPSKAINHRQTTGSSCYDQATQSQDYCRLGFLATHILWWHGKWAPSTSLRTLKPAPPCVSAAMTGPTPPRQNIHEIHICFIIGRTTKVATSTHISINRKQKIA